MNNNDLPTEDLAVTDKMDFHGCTVKESIFMVVAFVAVLTVIWIVFGAPDSKFTAVHPRKFVSIPAIFLSNFFHRDRLHLISNLIAFVPLGFLVFKLEGWRGLAGVFVGMLIAGSAVWLFGRGPSAGFSGAVMACWGILFISVIRRDYRLVVVFLVLSYLLMETDLFETIRPSSYAKAEHISWLGHLGGIIGGMASQIRSLPVALELLYKEGKVTKEEFVTIAKRINKDASDEVSAKNFSKAVNDFQNAAKKNANSKDDSTHENTDKKDTDKKE